MAVVRGPSRWINLSPRSFDFDRCGLPGFRVKGVVGRSDSPEPLIPVSLRISRFSWCRPFGSIGGVLSSPPYAQASTGRANTMIVTDEALAQRRDTANR
jgi:hypothetical protein